MVQKKIVGPWKICGKFHNRREARILARTLTTYNRIRVCKLTHGERESAAPSSSPRTAPARNVAAPRLAGLLRLVRRYRQMGGTLWQPILVLLSVLAFALLVMLVVWLYLFWIPAGR